MARLEKRHYFQCPDSKRTSSTVCTVARSTIDRASHNIIQRDGKETSEVRYFISSLDVGVKKFAAAVRGHCP